MATGASHQTCMAFRNEVSASVDIITRDDKDWFYRLRCSYPGFIIPILFGKSDETLNASAMWTERLKAKNIRVALMKQMIVREQSITNGNERRPLRVEIARGLKNNALRCKKGYRE